MDLATVGVAAVVIAEDGLCKDIRIALGAVAPTPIRARRAESILCGESVSERIIEAAAEVAATEASPISDMRGSADYRRELVRVLARRTLKQSCEELGTTF